jgi:hypothetical protein
MQQGDAQNARTQFNQLACFFAPSQTGFFPWRWDMYNSRSVVLGDAFDLSISNSVLLSRRFVARKSAHSFLDLFWLRLSRGRVSVPDALVVTRASRILALGDRET